MVPDEFVEELRGTWGPAPNDLERRAIWDEGMELLAQVPKLLGETIRTDGTPFESLLKDLGSAETLEALEVQCIRRFLSQKLATIHEVVVEVSEEAPWSHRIKTLTPVKRSRLRARLSEDINNKLVIVLLANLELREWLFPQ